MATKPKLWWFVNRFHNGGAELGLEHLIQHGFFDAFDLQILTLCEGDKEFRARIEKQAGTAKVFRKKSRPDILTWALSPIWLFFHIIRHKPDVMILSLPQANIAGRLAVAVSKILHSHKPYVISFEHNTVLAKPIYEKLFKFLNTQIDAVFADCRETADVVKEKFSYPSHVPTYVVPLYACGEVKAPSENTGRATPVRLLSAGRLTTVKNHILQLEAVKILCDRGVDVQLTIYGDGSQRAPLEAYIAKHGLEKRVFLPGFARDWMSKEADIYLMTSKYEGLCIVILEAVQQGLPVIAYRTGGVKEYGQDSAYFIDTHCPIAVADHVENIIKDPDAAYKKITHGQIILREMFGKSNVIKKLHQVAGEVLNKIGFAGKPSS